MPFSIEPSDSMSVEYWRPTIPPPNSLTLSPTPISLSARTIAADSDGYEATNTTSGLVARMARIIEEKSTVLGG